MRHRISDEYLITCVDTTTVVELWNRGALVLIVITFVLSTTSS